MSVRLYLKPGITQQEEPEARFDKAERAFIWLINHDFQKLREIDETSLKNVGYITLEESFWKDLSGYTFAPGCYEGNGFEVTVGPAYFSKRGSNKESFLDQRQDIFGRFGSVNIAIEFWQALTRGEILPTRPLCRELSITEQAYAKQASIAIGLSSKIGDLEAKLAQAMIHIAHQGQIIQDYVLTPKG